MQLHWIEPTWSLLAVIICGCLNYLLGVYIGIKYQKKLAGDSFDKSTKSP